MDKRPRMTINMIRWGLPVLPRGAKKDDQEAPFRCGTLWLDTAMRYENERKVVFLHGLQGEALKVWNTAGEMANWNLRAMQRIMGQASRGELIGQYSLSQATEDELKEMIANLEGMKKQ